MAGKIATLDGETDLEHRDPATLDADERRTLRARKARMVVIPDADRDGICTGLYTVVTSGGEYTVDLESQHACTCPDTQYNAPENGCKHRKRVAMQVNETTCPPRGESVVPFARGLRALRSELREEKSYLEKHVLKAAHDGDGEMTAAFLEEHNTVRRLLKWV